MVTTAINTQSILELALRYQKEGNIDSAMEILTKALNEGNSSPDIEYFRIQIFLFKNNILEGMNELEKFMKKYSTHTWAFNDLGVIYSRQENYGKAIEYFQKTLSVSNRNAQALSNLLSVLIKTDCLDDARELSKVYEMKFPNDGEILNVLYRYDFQLAEKKNEEKIILGRVSEFGLNLINDKYKKSRLNNLHNFGEIKIESLIHLFVESDPSQRNPWCAKENNVHYFIIDTHTEIVDRDLLNTDSLKTLYWEFLNKCEDRFPEAKTVFFHEFPSDKFTDEQIRRRENILALLKEIAEQHQHVFNVCVENNEERTLAIQQWNEVEDNRTKIYLSKKIKTACVVQGDVRRGAKEILEFVQHHFDEVILSTWAEDEQKIPAGKFHSVINEKPENIGAVNRNLQRKSSAAGIALAENLDCTHVMKLRTDMLPTQLNVKKLLTLAHFNVPSGMTSRIVTCAFRNLTADEDWFSSVPDLFAFGAIEPMKLFWDDEGINYNADTNIPEQMIAEHGSMWIEKEDFGQGPYFAETELYAIFKDRLQKKLHTTLNHYTIAKKYLYLIDHEMLGICWFHSQQGFRSIVQALQHPWWTPEIWRSGFPTIIKKEYPTTLESEKDGLEKTSRVAFRNVIHQDLWFQQYLKGASGKQ